MSTKKKVLFVCLGNICRSPLAEGVFRHLVEDTGRESEFLIDSCGTGAWHVGNPPHQGSVKIAKQKGIDISSQVARSLSEEDLYEFEYIVAMDRSNRADINSFMLPNSPAEVLLLREFDPIYRNSKKESDLDVPDPYYVGGFDKVYDIIETSLKNFLKEKF